MSRRRSSDDNEGNATKRPAISPRRTRTYHRERRTNPTTYELPVRTRRPRNIIGPAAGTSEESLAGLLATPIVENWASRRSATPGPSVSTSSTSLSLLDRGLKMSRENPHFMQRTPRGTEFLSCYEKLGENEECVTCFLPLKNAERLTSPQCGHLIHDECLRDWHASEVEKYGTTNFLCPTCKENVTRVADDIQDAKSYKIIRYPYDPGYFPR
ncbi:hypothetical protein HA402_004533 [Bradysia odoriphaga]|nr:hypothetical protein HA402_004533 [Bradysia odoriphaga]